MPVAMYVCPCGVLVVMCGMARPMRCAVMTGRCVGSGAGSRRRIRRLAAVASRAVLPFCIGW